MDTIHIFKPFRISRVGEEFMPPHEFARTCTNPGFVSGSIALVTRSGHRREHQNGVPILDNQLNG